MKQKKPKGDAVQSAQPVHLTWCKPHTKCKMEITQWFFADSAWESKVAKVCSVCQRKEESVPSHAEYYEEYERRQCKTCETVHDEPSDGTVVTVQCFKEFMKAVHKVQNDIDSIKSSFRSIGGRDW